MTRPCSRYSRSLQLLRGFGSAERFLLPRKVWMNGKTDLHNQHAYNYQSKPPKGGCGGLFSTRRTWRTARDVVRIHARIAQSEWTYLVTHTMSDAANDVLRRKMFRKLLDRVRKLAGYAGHFWTTERHVRGQLHHHLVLRMREEWRYRSYILSWSQRYCGSSNGLDVKPQFGGSRAVSYAGKAFFYACKEAKDRKDVLPFRWWGTSKVVRSVRCSDDELPPLLSMASANRWRKCAYVSSAWATALCAQRTERYEWRRILRRRRLHLRRRIKSPADTSHELVSLRISR